MGQSTWENCQVECPGTSFSFSEGTPGAVLLPFVGQIDTYFGKHFDQPKHNLPERCADSWMIPIGFGIFQCLRVEQQVQPNPCRQFLYTGDCRIREHGYMQSCTSNVVHHVRRKCEWGGVDIAKHVILCSGPG